MINRTLHVRLEIRNFSSRVEKYFAARPCKILSLFKLAQTVMPHHKTCRSLDNFKIRVANIFDQRKVSIKVFLSIWPIFLSYVFDKISENISGCLTEITI